jgi:hypothetical protein
MAGMDTRSIADRLGVDVVSSLYALKQHWMNEGFTDLARQTEREIQWVEEATELLNAVSEPDTPS